MYYTQHTLNLFLETGRRRYHEARASIAGKRGKALSEALNECRRAKLFYRDMVELVHCHLDLYGSCNRQTAA